jgi:hypothetical protein
MAEVILSCRQLAALLPANNVELPIPVANGVEASVFAEVVLCLCLHSKGGTKP